MAVPVSQGRTSFFRSRGFKALAIFLAVVIVLWVATEIAGPLIADSVAKSRIQKKYPEATDVSVSIHAFPALKLAFKKYDSLTVNVGSVTLQGVRFDHIELKSTEWPKGTFTATISQDEIARFFSLKNSYVINPRLTIEQNGVVVAGNIDTGLLTVAVTSRGTLEAVDGKRVFFRPSDVQVMGVRAPDEAVALVRQVMDQNPVFTVREDLPYDITGVNAQRGKLVILGTVDMEKALNIHL